MGQIKIMPFVLSERLPGALAVMASAFGLGDTGRAQREQIVRRHARRPGLIARGAFAGGDLVGICYGFPSDSTAWWEQQIRRHLVAAGTEEWLAGGPFELTELHVRQEYQGRGLGRRLITEVLAYAEQPRAVLSVRDHPGPARRLYHSLGFRDLTVPFRFGPGQPAYLVMGADLPVDPPGGERRRREFPHEACQQPPGSSGPISSR